MLPELRAREPHVRGLSALLIPGTAVVDFHLIAEQLAAEIAGRAATSFWGTQSSRSMCNMARFTSPPTRTNGSSTISSCAPDCSRRFWHGWLVRLRTLRSSPSVGSTTRLTQAHTDLIRGLVYPVPDPRYPFLGVHFTRGLGGHVHVGPNAVLALSQEGYRWSDVRLREVWDTVTFPGMRKMARQHWRMGAREICGSVSTSIFLRRARAYVPVLTRADLVRSGAGVRLRRFTATDRSQTISSLTISRR